MTYSDSISVSAGANLELLTPLQRSKLQHLTAIPGSGKTYAYSLDVAQRVGDRFIIACISKTLAEEVATELLQKGVDVRLIMDGENKKFKEVARVTTALRQAIIDCDTRVLVVTHAAIELLGEIIYTDEKLRCQMAHWSLIVDEMPNARKDVKAIKIDMKWFTEFGHLNRGDMLTSEHYRCLNEKKKFQRRV